MSEFKSRPGKQQIDVLQAIVLDLADASSANFTEETTQEDLALRTERYSRSLDKLASEYRNLSGLVHSIGPMVGVVEATQDCYMGVLNDFEAVLTEAETRIRTFLASPREAIRKGFVSMTPEGAFELSKLFSDLPEWRAALDRLGALTQRTAAQLRSGCLLPLIGFLFTAAAVVSLLTRSA